MLSVKASAVLFIALLSSSLSVNVVADTPPHGQGYALDGKVFQGIDVQNILDCEAGRPEWSSGKYVTVDEQGSDVEPCVPMKPLHKLRSADDFVIGSDHRPGRNSFCPRFLNNDGQRRNVVNRWCHEIVNNIIFGLSGSRLASIHPVLANNPMSILGIVGFLNTECECFVGNNRPLGRDRYSYLLFRDDSLSHSGIRRVPASVSSTNADNQGGNDRSYAYNANDDLHFSRSRLCIRRYSGFSLVAIGGIFAALGALAGWLVASGAIPDAGFVRWRIWSGCCLYVLITALVCCSGLACG